MSKGKIIISVIVCTIFIVADIFMSFEIQSMFASIVGSILTIFSSIIFVCFMWLADCLEK